MGFWGFGGDVDEAGGLNDNLGGVEAASLVVTLVGVVGLKGESVVLSPGEDVVHPSTVAALGAVWASLGAVDNLLLREAEEVA